MAASFEELLEQAMDLPPEARARLAALLEESLDADGPASIYQQWLTEAKRRRDEVRSGQVQTIPGPEALSQVRNALRR
jgi:hypothetical protein